MNTIDIEGVAEEAAPFSVPEGRTTHQRRGPRAVIDDGRRQIGCSSCRDERALLFVTVGRNGKPHSSCPACRDEALMYIRTASDDWARRFNRERSGRRGKPWRKQNLDRPVIPFVPERLNPATYRAWKERQSVGV